MKSSRIIFFGNERLSSGYQPGGAPTLEALLAASYEVAAVVANHEAGQSRKPRPLEIEAVAKAHNIPLLLPERPADIADQLAAYKADIGVLVAYGRLVPESIIKLFPRGIVNIHPSLLPRYRGSTPIEQAILDGAPQTGVSLMQLVKQMDAGPIYAQTSVELSGTETKADLTTELLRLGGRLLISHLPAILDGSAQPTPQDESLATFTKLLTKADARLDLSQPAAELERAVRAFAGWPKSHLSLFNQDIIVTLARVASQADDGELVVACGGDSWLEILQLVGPSGRTMSGGDFKRGYKK